MSQIAPIPEEEAQHEQNRLAQYYQNLLNRQAEERKAERIPEAEPSDTSSDEDKTKDQTPQQQQVPADSVHLHDADEPAPDSAVYTRHQILSQCETDPTSGLQTPDQLASPDGLDAGDRELIRRLQARDAEVRQHEMRHVASLGRYAGAVQLHYQIGPDGRAYAVGGTTEVRASGPSDPASSATRARQVRQAALAGGDPSNADISAAVQATRSEQAAMGRIISAQ